MSTLNASASPSFRSGIFTQGGEQHHMSLRHDVVAFMQDHEPDFAPYMEDDENFNSYTKRMKKVRPSDNGQYRHILTGTLST